MTGAANHFRAQHHRKMASAFPAYGRPHRPCAIKRLTCVLLVSGKTASASGGAGAPVGHVSEGETLPPAPRGFSWRRLASIGRVKGGAPETGETWRAKVEPEGHLISR